MHTDNIFVELGHNGGIQNIVVDDFGCSSTKVNWGFDWDRVGEILSTVEKMTEKIEYKERASFYDLLFDPTYGLIRGKSHLKGRQILPHPFFNEEYKEQSDSR